MAGSEISSYQKGINKLLEKREKFEHLIIEYLLSVNSKYSSNMFPTPQLAKVLLAKLKMKKTQFPILHKIVRTILKEWSERGWCDYVTTTKSGRNRRTKYIYKFSPEQFQFLKGRFISSSINEIEKNIMESEVDSISDAMKSRDLILENWIREIQDLLVDVDMGLAEDDDKLDPDEEE